MEKVFVFGIDGATPELIFDKWIDELPTIRQLMQSGSYGTLSSSIPPMTIIAWNSMFSGKDASELGFFSYSYQDKQGKTKLVSSKNVAVKRIWDILSSHGKKTISLFVPLTYPVTEINGTMVSCFLTPELNDKSCYPKKMTLKIRKLGDTEFFFDVGLSEGAYKSLEIDEILKRTYRMTEMQLDLLEDLMSREKWDFFCSVMIGTDRLQHMLWRHFDSNHRRYIKDSPYKNALLEYYKYLDGRLAKILKHINMEETTVLVVSDHGMIRQQGKININNWLMEEGYLVLKAEYKNRIKNEKVRFRFEAVDMQKTICYASGAYHARIFINKNKVGKDYVRIREDLINKLKKIPDDKGNQINTLVYKKEDIYKKPSHPDCPDLTVYFDNLSWASNPDLGFSGLYSWETVVGADNAGHSMQGCFIISGNKIKNRGKIGEIDIKQVFPTLCKLLHLNIPKDKANQPIEVF